MILEKNHGENNNNEDIKSITETYEIKADKIDVNNYFLSLTDNASNVGLLNEEDILFIQSQIYDIISDNIRMYTKGSSDSVTSEEANELMLSVVNVLNSFCISETGINITSADENKLDELIKIFKEKSGIKNSYEKGLKFTGKTSAQEIASERMASELSETLKSYDNFYTVDFDELMKLENEMEMESNDIKNKIVADYTMTDMEFNRLCLNISKCKTAGQKADLIIKSIASAGDFLDILNAQCLFDDDYLVLYEKLSEQSPETIMFLMNNFENPDDEWQKYLSEFIEKRKNS